MGKEELRRYSVVQAKTEASSTSSNRVSPSSDEILKDTKTYLSFRLFIISETSVLARETAPNPMIETPTTSLIQVSFPCQVPVTMLLALDMLFVILRRSQVMQVKKIVKEIDPDAFTFSHNIKEAYGNGFLAYKPPKIEIAKLIKSKNKKVKHAHLDEIEQKGNEVNDAKEEVVLSEKNINQEITTQENVNQDTQE